MPWWDEQRYSFPVLSCLGRHFSGAGRIVHKDRNRLKDDAVAVYYNIELISTTQAAGRTENITTNYTYSFMH